MNRQNKNYELLHNGTNLRPVDPKKTFISKEMMDTVNTLALSINFSDMDWPRIARKGKIGFMLDMHIDVAIQLMRNIYGIEAVHAPSRCYGCGKKVCKLDIRKFNMAIILDEDGIPYNRLIVTHITVPGINGESEIWELPMNDPSYNYFEEKKKRAKSEDSHYLYLMKEESTEYYKVGICNNANKRIAAMQTSNPRVVNMIGIRKCSSRESAREDEKQMHHWLENNTKRATGEWYMIDDYDLVDSMREKLFTEYIKRE